MPRLIIITPVTRPSNLPAIYNNLLSYVGEDLPITWYVIFDKNCEQAGAEWKERFSRSENRSLAIITIISKIENASAGNAHRNQVLRLLENEHEKQPELGDFWVYFLDDNNILHPEFCKILRKGYIENLGLLFFRSADVKSISRYNILFNYFKGDWPRHFILFIPFSFFCVKFKYLNGLRITDHDPAYNFIKKLVERIPEDEQKNFTDKTFDNYYS